MEMEDQLKLKLSMYGVISGLSYIYLVMSHNAGISIPIFIGLQFVLIFILIRQREEIINKKSLWMFIPIFILSLNYFTSGSYLWNVPNFFAIVLLYSMMILIMQDRFPIKEPNLKFIGCIIRNVFRPFLHFAVPFKWCGSLNKDAYKIQIAKRVLMGILITLPIVMFLTFILSSADMIFSRNIALVSKNIFSGLEFDGIFKLIVGFWVGLYLLGLMYSAFIYNSENKEESVNDLKRSFQMQGDLIILNMLFISILFVYTFFIAIQFKYLFAGAELPYGLNYAEYARKGFFELIFLSFLNVGLILLTVFLLKDKIYVAKTKWSNISKIFMLYLCIVTFMMLVSSFYRMMLYDGEYGFTRLRVLVYGFLIFEAIGLIMTFIYVLRPKFNIVAVYAVIGLCYYLILNMVNIDYIIAKRNIDLYLSEERKGGMAYLIDTDYLMRLSTDAAPQIARLLDKKGIYAFTRMNAEEYFENIELRHEYNKSEGQGWQSYNLSDERALKIKETYNLSK